MPNKETLRRAQRDKRQGKAASTQAGEFIREEMHHIREGKHGARSAKQAVAIGLSKARRAGVELPAPEKGTVPEKTRKSAKRAYELGQAVRARRLALGMSQTELANGAGMTQSAVSRLEAGGTVPTIGVLERLAAALSADLVVTLTPKAA